MLEDEKDELERELGNGHAINASNTTSSQSSKINVLPAEAKNDSSQNDEPDVEKVMDTIRKAGLDSPKNVKRIQAPKSREGLVDDVDARSNDAKVVLEHEDAAKENNKTADEANLQASLQDTLQSAVSGIVEVFNNQVDGHSVMKAKGTLKTNDNETATDNSDEDSELLDFAWTPWSEWGSCSVSCGRGWISRRRFCLTVTRKCEGRAIEMKFCHSRPCPGEYTLPSFATISESNYNPRLNIVVELQKWINNLCIF